MGIAILGDAPNRDSSPFVPASEVLKKVDSEIDENDQLSLCWIVSPSGSIPPNVTIYIYDEGKAQAVMN